MNLRLCTCLGVCADEREWASRGMTYHCPSLLARPINLPNCPMVGRSDDKGALLGRNQRRRMSHLESLLVFLRLHSRGLLCLHRVLLLDGFLQLGLGRHLLLLQLRVLGGRRCGCSTSGPLYHIAQRTKLSQDGHQPGVHDSGAVGWCTRLTPSEPASTHPSLDKHASALDMDRRPRFAFSLLKDALGKAALES